jgi:selenocysteine lyase/cysteine desulfurase
VEFIAGIATSAEDRRTRVLESMRAVEVHEERLFAKLLDGLGDVAGLTLHGSPKRRTPTALFSLTGHAPAEVYEALAARDVNAPASSFYAVEAMRWIGLGDGGAVRAGIAPYTDDDDVDRLVEALREVAG